MSKWRLSIRTDEEPPSCHNEQKGNCTETQTYCKFFLLVFWYVLLTNLKGPTALLTVKFKADPLSIGSEIFVAVLICMKHQR
jgi:hypothetical protein